MPDAGGFVIATISLDARLTARSVISVDELRTLTSPSTPPLRVVIVFITVLACMRLGRGVTRNPNRV